MAGSATADQNRTARGHAAGVVDQAPEPGPEHERLEVFIGKWIDESHTTDPAFAGIRRRCQGGRVMDRRTLLKTVGIGIPAFAGMPLAARRAAGEEAATPWPAAGALGAAVHTYQSPQTGFFVNAYLVETPAGIVVVDGTLTVSDSRAVRAKLEAIGKPLLAVLVTHPHPDHYAGVAAVVAGDDVPVVSAASVDRIIRRDDVARDQVVGGLIGAEWPANRMFPNQTLADGESVTFGDVEFTLRDTGEGESGADTYWTASALPGVVFTGDLIYPFLDSYNADGFSGRWLAKIDRLESEFGGAALLYPGHGGAATPAALGWQRRYLEQLRETVRSLANGQPTLTDAQKAEAKQRMDEFVPDQRLEFFVEISLDPVAAELASSG
jgi:glyoxylase-like metal-dependent hydrolase (beta-lactamase superfamily II)